MTKKIKVILTCLKQTSYEDYTHFFKTVEIEVFAKVQTEEQMKFLLEKLNNKYVRHLRSNYV